MDMHMAMHTCMQSSCPPPRVSWHSRAHCACARLCSVVLVAYLVYNLLIRVCQIDACVVTGI